MTVELQRHGATALLLMNRPTQRNALDPASREAFAAAVAEVRDDNAIRAVVLAGAGGHFCSGADAKTLAANQQAERDIFEGRERIRKINRWFDQLVDLEKPVIAAVEGVCFGAGLSIALAADFVLSSPSASYCAVFARIGYVPDMGGMYLLPRAVGLAQAKELVFTARVVAADEALRMGLVQQVVEGDVLQAAMTMAERFHAAPTQAIGLAKRVMNRSFETSRDGVFEQEALAQALCRESSYHQQAVKRFVDKQPPMYLWK